MSKINIGIKGMHCAACVARVEKKLSKLEGVRSVDVSLTTNSAFINYDESKTGIDEFAKALDTLGFEYQPYNSDTSQTYDEEVVNLKKRLLISIIFGFPVVILAMGPMIGLPLHNIKSNFFIQFILTSVIFLYSGSVFNIPAVKNLKNLSFDMNTLIFTGTTSAYIFSVIFTFSQSYWFKFGINEPYFESVCVIISAVLLGRVMEAKAKRNVADSVTKLFELTPKTAYSIDSNGAEFEINISDVLPDMLLRLKPGSAVAVDGVVTGGSASIDESVLTGESVPVDKKDGDTVYAGTHVISGSLDYKALKIGRDTVLGTFIKQVQEAVYSKAPVQKLVDKVASVFVPVVIVIALITLLFWLVYPSGIQTAHAFVFFVTVLIIACPCALGLATPAAIMAAVGRGAKEGILIKNAQVLENAGLVDTVVLDKTGTLTNGDFVFKDIVCYDLNSSELLSLVGSLETLSEHPIAKAITRECNKRNIALKKVADFKNYPGGVSGTVDNKNITAGSQYFMQSQGIELDGESFKGFTTFYIAVDKKYTGRIALGDTIREDSPETINKLKNLKLKLIMLSGDNSDVCTLVADKLGITDVYSGATPASKRELILKLKKDGRTVAMIGDGVNDAAALAEADVGIAVSHGTDIAVSTSDISLMGDELTKLPKVINLSRKAHTIIKQNLFWAFFYNILGIPVAAGVLYPNFGIQLNPMIAGVAMACSSVMVLFNAMRLKQISL